MIEIIQLNEVVQLIVGVGVFLLIYFYKNHLLNLPHREYLIVAFLFSLTGWVLTILEGFIFENLLNNMEHFCYSVSSILLMIWCYKVFRWGWK